MLYQCSVYPLCIYCHTCISVWYMSICITIQDLPIILLFHLLCYAAVLLKFYLLCSRTRIVARLLCYLYTSLYGQQVIFERLLYQSEFANTVVRESTITLLDDDCSIRVYKLFPTILCKHMNIAINIFYIFPTMLALCLMFAMTHYFSIMGGSLITFP